MTLSRDPFATAFQIATTSCRKSIDSSYGYKVFQNIKEKLKLIMKSKSDDLLKLLGTIYGFVNKWREVSNQAFEKIHISKDEYDRLILQANEDDYIIMGLFERSWF